MGFYTNGQTSKETKKKVEEQNKRIKKQARSIYQDK